MKQQEYELISQADQTWVVSEAERKLLLQDLPGKQIEVVSNIVDIETRRQLSPPCRLSVIGSFLTPPNVDAVLYFAKEIYPLVAQHLPTAKFYVIGDKAPPEVVGLASQNVIVTGAVPDVRPFFDSVKLSVAPLRFGAGVKAKSIRVWHLEYRRRHLIAVEGMSLSTKKTCL